MSTKIHQRVAPGIYRLASGRFRVKVAVGDRRHGGRQRETTFPADAGLREMKAWQTHERARLLRQGIVPARGMLEADVPSYLSKMKRKLSYPASREDEINAWLAASVTGSVTPSRETRFVVRSRTGKTKALPRARSDIG